MSCTGRHGSGGSRGSKWDISKDLGKLKGGLKVVKMRKEDGN